MLEFSLLLAAAAEEGHGEFVEPYALGFSPTGWVALAMVAVLALMIWKKVPAAVGRALDKNIALIRDQLAEAETLRKEAEALKAEYEAKAKAADGDAKAMLERAEAESKAIVKKAKADAEALVERRGKMAEAKIAAEERAAIDEIRASAAKVATAAAAKLIADKGDAKADKALVDQAIAGLGR
jgi:F-type H+-transporting ATPase subunit b